jgi:zinc protease
VISAVFRCLAAARKLAAASTALILASVVLAPAQATNIERVVSPGGIEAWLVRDATVPVVTMQFAFKGGSSQDPAGKSGLAEMVSSLLDEGAGELDAKAFQERLEEQAIELRFSDDRDYFRGSLRTLRERSADAFELLRLALNAPRFDADAVERIRGQIAVMLRREASDPSTLASQSWWSTAFPDHPYGRPEKGTPESVASLTSEDLRTYVRRVFARDTLKIAIVGDIDAAEAGRQVDRVFGSLPAHAELTPVPQVAPSGLGRRVVVDFAVPQAIVSMGTTGLPRKHPDFVAAYVLNHIFGGGSFTSRLYQEVREKRGYAYGVSTYLYPMEHTALFLGWTQVRADRAAESIAVIEHEMRQMAESGPTEEELDKAKAFLKGSFALRFDTSAKIAAQLVQIQIDELGIDYINRRNDLIDAVTLADTKRIAKVLLSGKLLITIVGRPKGLTTSGGPG